VNAPLRAASFGHAAPETLARPQHLRTAAPPARERVIGVIVAGMVDAAVAAALILGFQVAAPLIAAKPIMADIIPVKQKPPETMTIMLPKFTAAPAVTAPEPVFEIAPTPHAIRAAPPRAVIPVAPPAPGPVPASDHGESRATYLGVLLARLNRFKQYPPQARAAHIQGVVMLHFVLDRSGRLLSAQIAKSSGRPALDREALALIARAEPLPPMPPAMGGERLDAIVPIAFSLRD
jgi:protein TonB